MEKFMVMLKSRLFNFVFVFSVWMISVWLLSKFGLLTGSESNILLLIHLGAFFFALTTSPVTWIIKGFGIEVGSNTPDHFQVDKIVKKDGETIVIVRDYSHTHGEKEINEILSEQTPKS